MEVVSSLPAWGQEILLLSITFVATIIGVLKYVKTEDKSSGQDSTIDSHLIKRLIETLLDIKDSIEIEHKRTQKHAQDLRESIKALDSSINIRTDILVGVINEKTNNTSQLL